MSRDNLETIPVWVRLPNLNFCFRTSSALSKFTTVIGNPICMDHATATGTRFAFARVYVEVGIDAEFPTELRMKYKDKTILQKVEYAWRPSSYKTCKTFTHGDNSCILKTVQHKPKQVWVPKKSSLVGIPAAGVDAGVGVEVQCNIQQEEMPRDLAMVEWTAVTGKQGPGRTVSPLKSQSPSKRPTQLINVEPNRFLSLSNLDGDLSVGPNELSATTALVLHHSGSSPVMSATGHDSGHILSVNKLPIPLGLLVLNQLISKVMFRSKNKV